MIDRHHVMATAKHFAVHAQPEGGTNTAPGNYSERVIRENFFIPFQAAVEEAHVGSIMASYNEIDGVPSHINRWLLDKVLRQEWGFRRLPITPTATACRCCVKRITLPTTMRDAARQGLAAGVDYDLSDGSVYRTSRRSGQAGPCSGERSGRCGARMFSPRNSASASSTIPYVDPDYAETITNSEEHRKLAIEAAAKVIVLLKNDKNLLPLDLSKLKTIAVIGPNAADVHLGGYSRDPGQGVSILDGIKARVGDKANVLYARGLQDHHRAGGLSRLVGRQR